MNAHDLDSLERLNAAIARLKEAPTLPVGKGVNLDGTIQRFEFTFELLWKCAKRALLANGIDARSPRDVIKACYAQGWLDDEPAWLNMLKDRNLTSHTYVQDLALEIHARLPAHLDLIQVLAAKLGSVVATNR